MLVTNIILFAIVVLTCFILLMLLPNFLWGWQYASGFTFGLLHAPVTVKVVLTPLYSPLTADHALFTLLGSTDTKTNKQVQELLAYGALEGKKIIVVDGNDVDLEELIKTKMNAILPDKSYYLAVRREKENVLEFGTSEIETENYEPCNIESMLTYFSFGGRYASTATLTLPNLERLRVVLVIG
jgi:hypothetical protein